ncbi:MAG: YdiU family protein [Hyphomonadaceae bacterium]|nr:YdiU family protein [Hyphomonadaceae bacterium]
MTAPILEISSFFADAAEPASFPQTVLRYSNTRWAKNLGLNLGAATAWERHFGRFESLPGNLPSPLALRYHGHQFHVYNPDLGDGRGFLFAQLRDERGRLLDLGTKGSGQTRWSRQGDGRLTLKGGVREVLAATYLEALGVNTSKIFSLIETGEELHRNDEPSPTRSAVMVRLNHSHLRFGTFQRAAYHDDSEGMAALVRHIIKHYYPDCEDEALGKAVPALFERMAAATARMIGQWMAVGFVHGVMNTDNFNITGETFDFGPWRFLEKSDPNFVAAYFDQQGLYRFGRQPAQGLWALQQLGGALTLLAESDDLSAAMGVYEPTYQDSFAGHTLALLGLQRSDTLRDDLLFLQDFYAWMTTSEALWPQLFFDWFGGEASAARARASPQSALYETADFAAIRSQIEARTPDRPERLEQAYFQKDRPVDLLIDTVEALWAEIAETDNWDPFNAHLAHMEQARQAYDWDAV